MPRARRRADNSLYIDTPIDFQVASGYAALAKLMLGLVLLLIAAVGRSLGLSFGRSSVA